MNMSISMCCTQLCHVFQYYLISRTNGRPYGRMTCLGRVGFAITHFNPLGACHWLAVFTEKLMFESLVKCVHVEVEFAQSNYRHRVSRHLID